MPLDDVHGLPHSGAGEKALAAYAAGLDQFRCFVGDPVASADAALADAPDFVMAHVLKGYLYGLSSERAGLEMARQCHASAAALPATAREKGHLAALDLIARGRLLEAGRVLEDVSIEHPRDALALQAGHQIDFFTGNARMLRDRIARALPAWDAAMPGYHALLGMHAFGLEETGDYARAEASGRRAVELDQRDGWARHAVAHVMEMQSRQNDGVAWLGETSHVWSDDSFLKTHNWWHLALFHYELGGADAVLALFDGPIFGERSPLALNLVDAASLLWRLTLAGIDVGARWEAVADGWMPFASSANSAFNDAHAMMAFVGAGRRGPQQTLLAAQLEALGAEDDNAVHTRDIGRPVALAIQAFGEGRYGETTRLLRPVLSIAHRFGGSHAQRDVLDLTLIEAALRGGQTALAAALVAERRDARPASPLSQLFTKRAAATTARG